MKTTITRIRDNGKLTLGRLSIGDYQCVTLEPSFVLNQGYISCIPTGTYPLVKRESQKYGTHFHVTDVPDRTFILIHTLNYFKQSEGCIGVGQRFKYLDADNEIDVTNSRKTLNQLLATLPDESEIEITNHDKIQTFY